jgi:hypothetical protein
MIYSGKIIRPCYTKKNNRKKNIDESMKDMNINGGSVPILLGANNNYLVSGRGMHNLRKSKGTKKEPIKLLL